MHWMRKGVRGTWPTACRVKRVVLGWAMRRAPPRHGPTRPKDSLSLHAAPLAAAKITLDRARIRTSDIFLDP